MLGQLTAPTVKRVASFTYHSFLGDNLPFLVLGATDGVSKIDVPTVDISGGFPFGDVNQTVVYVSLFTCCY